MIPAEWRGIRNKEWGVNSLVIIHGFLSSRRSSTRPRGSRTTENRRVCYLLVNFQLLICPISGHFLHIFWFLGVFLECGGFCNAKSHDSIPGKKVPKRPASTQSPFPALSQTELRRLLPARPERRSQFSAGGSHHDFLLSSMGREGLRVEAHE